MLLGADPLGSSPLGSGGLRTAVNITLTAIGGAYATTGNSALFKISQTSIATSFSLTGNSANFLLNFSVTGGTFSEAGIAAQFSVSLLAAEQAYVVTGNASLANTALLASGETYSITAFDAPLTRTGDDYDFKLGGVGHLLEEIERQKRLNAITRKIPAPVDRRTIPRFEPLRGPSIAPAAPAPDMAPAQNQRMAEAVAQAKAAKRRRDEEAVLLLAS